MMGDGEDVRFDWRRGGAAAAGLVAALILVVMLFLVKFANDACDQALSAERKAYEVALVVRNVSANVSRADAALARFVLDEDEKGSGNIYASAWQLAGFQIHQLNALERYNPEQRRRVGEVQALYQKHGRELALAAQAALAKQGDTGISYFYASAKSGTGRQLDDRLEEIIRAERQSLRSRQEQSQLLAAQADQLTNYLSTPGIIVDLRAIVIRVVAVQALCQNDQAGRAAVNEAARSEPLLPERVDSSELIEGMSDLLDRTLGEQIRVDVDLAPSAWPIYVDPHRLENAIVNLAVNARDAMDGRGLMRIATENVKLAANEVGDVRAGDYVKISLTDTGCGMEPDVLERAFEPFFTTKPVGKGTGLGLSQIFGFAHESGGEVGIESQVGKGTTVSIYLPRAEAIAANVRLHPAMQRGEVEATVPGARILLVEDDPRVRAST